MLNPTPRPPGRRNSFTPAPLPLRRAPTLVPEVAPAPVRRSAIARRVAVFAAVVGIAIGVVASSSGTRTFKGATAAAQAWFASQVDASSDAWDRHIRQGAVVEELAAMTVERDALAIELMQLQAIEREHARLIRLLGMSEPLGLHGVVGRVIARPTSGRRTLRIDVGTEAGVGLGQAVVAHDGLVGQVVDAGEGWSDVLMAMDPRHAAAVVLPDLEVHGTLRGMGDSLLVDHIIAGTEIPEGSLVVTSGEGGVFPRGIPVGSVVHVSRETGPLLRVELSPATEPGFLAEVFVVFGQSAPVEPASAEHAVEAPTAELL